MQERARQVVRILQARGHQAYLVGGCVRDLLLGSEPKDYDIATSAAPQQVLTLFPGSVLVGVHFGVVIVDQHLEVATFRSDHGYEDGRRPARVEFETDPRQDVLRRDFTINALLLDPVYTGKAMSGLIDLTRKGELTKDDTIIFVHTGGLPATFAYRDAIQEMSSQ